MNKLSDFILRTMGTDGLMHFTVSSTGAACMKQVMSPCAAFIGVLVVGILKEVYDKASKKGTPEIKDLMCDAAGALVGSL